MDYYGRTNYGHDNRHSIDRPRSSRGRTYPDYNEQRSHDRRGNGYRNSGNNQSSYQQKSESKSKSSCTSKNMMYVWLGILTFMLLGSISLGGVALHYAVFDTEIDSYQASVILEYVPFDTNTQTVGSIGWLDLQLKTCTNALEMKMGSKLKKCRVLDTADSSGNTQVIIDLQVERKRPVSISKQYITIDLEGRYSLYKLATSNVPDITLQSPYVSVTITQEAAGLTISQGQKNNTAYSVVEKSICSAAETKLGGDLYVECYMKSATSNLLTVEINVDRASLYDLLLEGVLKQRRNVENSQNVIKAKLNTGTLKIDAFANVLFQAKTVVVVL